MDKKNIWLIILSVLIVVCLVLSIYNTCQINKTNENLVQVVEGVSLAFEQYHQVDQIIGEELGIDLSERLEELKQQEQEEELAEAGYEMDEEGNIVEISEE